MINKKRTRKKSTRDKTTIEGQLLEHLELRRRKRQVVRLVEKPGS
jgi:hypothetical protein